MFNVSQARTQQPQNAQQQRSMPSPGTPATTSRQSPFPAEAFPPPASPTASQFPPPVPNANVTNPSTQYRLQRTTSTPSATTQLPGSQAYKSKIYALRKPFFLRKMSMMIFIFFWSKEKKRHVILI